MGEKVVPSTPAKRTHQLTRRSEPDAVDAMDTSRRTAQRYSETRQHFAVRHASATRRAFNLRD